MHLRNLTIPQMSNVEYDISTFKRNGDFEIKITKKNRRNGARSAEFIHVGAHTVLLSTNSTCHAVELCLFQDLFATL